jgi:hypothetical protein
MITVEKQMRNLVSKYLNPQRNKVSEYLKKTAEFIKDNVYEIEPPADGLDYEIVYKELMGLRQKLTHVSVGSETVEAQWTGPFCSEETEDGYVLGPFGVPEVVKLIKPRQGDQKKKQADSCCQNPCWWLERTRRKSRHRA